MARHAPFPLPTACHGFPLLGLPLVRAAELAAAVLVACREGAGMGFGYRGEIGGGAPNNSVADFHPLSVNSVE